MASFEGGECIGVAVPKRAIEVKVTNIVNPYFIRIRKEPHNREAERDLIKVLSKLVKQKTKKGLSKSYSPSVGDDVIISAGHLSDVNELPAWVCRGVITDTGKESTDVFLLDYGIAINVPPDSLINYSRESNHSSPLTMSVGMHNILPVDSELRILKQWPNDTVDFIKELFQASKKIFFEALSCDKESNKNYGDFFLLIENKNVCLSKALIHCYLAVPLYDELLQALTDTNAKGEIHVPYQVQKREITSDRDISAPTRSDSLSSSERLRIKEKQIHEKILIRSKNECEPLDSVAEARFPASLHKVLQNNGLTSLKNIQKYMWPAIKRKLNVISINSPKTGKSIGYAVPMISGIVSNEEKVFEKLKSDSVNKPTALILCASSNECVNVTAWCQQILSGHSRIKAYAAFYGIQDKNILVQICNKFSILVSTPPFLLRLLEKFSNHLDLSELSYLVLDGADILLTKYLKDIVMLIKKYKIINKNISDPIVNDSTQIISVAQTWTKEIQSFKDLFIEDPYTCIGSYTEAAAFCKVQGRMLIRHSDQKKDEVLGILQGRDFSREKIMIICVNSEEAIDLNEFLISQNLKTLLVHEGMTVDKIMDMKDDWIRLIPGSYPVIICSDPVVLELNVSDIVFLIHYSITETSKSQFNRRFSVLMDNWLLDLKYKCKMLILFDETKENEHFKGVINILKRLNVELPNDWDEISNGLDVSNNFKKKNYPLCENIKLVGVCETSSCPYRHRIIAEVDAPKTNISIGDELKLIYITSHSATHFSARIHQVIRTCKITGQKKTIDFSLVPTLALNSKMKKYYSDANNRRTPKDVCVGKMYAMKKFDKTISRVQILNIVEVDTKANKPKTFEARALEEGYRYNRVKLHELYELPEEFANHSSIFIDVYLGGIAPYDEESKWTDLACNEAKMWFIKNKGESSFIHVKVFLHMEYAVWTESLVIRTKVSGYADINSPALEKDLKKQEHGIDNDKHLPNLIRLCYAGGLTEINGYSIQLPTIEDELNASIDECD